MLSEQYPGCVYAATNPANGRRYIGKTTMPLAKRKRCHKAAARRGSRLVFHGALRKYGFDVFDWTVLFVSADEPTLYAAEQEIIATARAGGERLYNRTNGGEGATGASWTEEAREKLRRSVTGMKRSEEARRRMSEASKGRRKSDEHRRKVSLAKTGVKLNPWTPERRAKMEAAWARWKLEGRRCRSKGRGGQIG